MELLPTNTWDGCRPLVIQASPEIPLVIGTWPGGADVPCPSCKHVVLLQNVIDESVFDLTLRCAGCGAESNTPAFPPGRGLAVAGAIQAFDSGVIAAKKSVVLRYDEIVIGKPGVLRRQLETGRLVEHSTTRHAELNESTIEGLIAEARDVFGPIIPTSSEPTCVAEAGTGFPSCSGSSSKTLLRFERAKERLTCYPRSSSNETRTHIGAGRGIQCSRTCSETAETPARSTTNVLVVTLASQLDNAGLGPELVPTGNARSPDLRFRITARVALEADIKAPTTLQRRAGIAVPVKEAREIVADAITSSRGQFSTTGLLVIAGSFWTGDFDAVSKAAVQALATPLPESAKAAARDHRERMLCGVILMSRYVEQHWLEPREVTSEGQPGWMQNSSLRWIANPLFGGDIRIDFNDNVSEFTLTVPPAITGQGAAEDPPTHEGR